MTKEQELAATIAEQWGNAAFNKEELLRVFKKEHALDFAHYLSQNKYYPNDSIYEVWRKEGDESQGWFIEELYYKFIADARSRENSATRNVLKLYISEQWNPENRIHGVKMSGATVEIFGSLTLELVRDISDEQLGKMIRQFVQKIDSEKEKYSAGGHTIP